jgi:hypothetical protein
VFNVSNGQRLLFVSRGGKCCGVPFAAIIRTLPAVIRTPSLRLSFCLQGPCNRPCMLPPRPAPPSRRAKGPSLARLGPFGGYRLQRCDKCQNVERWMHFMNLKQLWRYCCINAARCSARRVGAPQDIVVCRCRHTHTHTRKHRRTRTDTCAHSLRHIPSHTHMPRTRTRSHTDTQTHVALAGTRSSGGRTRRDRFRTHVARSTSLIST